MSSAGDVNNDGYDDIVVGAPSYQTGGTGGAYLYLGSSAGLCVSPSWTAEGDEVGARFGASVSSAGDVNNDGYDDVVVGAPHNETLKGSAHLYIGSSTGLSSSSSWTIETDQVGDNFGWSVSSAGDVNNDGFDDVVVGASSYDNPETNEGRAYLYLGSPTGLSETPSWTAEGDQAGARFGYSVSSAGDVNGDDYDEVVVGEPWRANPEMGEGRAYLYGEFALIPEFTMLLVPVTGAVAILVALRRLHASGKK